jgi:hypothetical protein
MRKCRKKLKGWKQSCGYAQCWRITWTKSQIHYICQLNLGPDVGQWNYPKSYCSTKFLQAKNPCWEGQYYWSGRGGKKFLHPMEQPPSPSSTTATPDCHEFAQRLGKMIAEAIACCSALLHYDSASQSMVKWCWWVLLEPRVVKRINSGQGQILIKRKMKETDIVTSVQPSLLCLHRQVRSIQGEAR